MRVSCLVTETRTTVDRKSENNNGAVISEKGCLNMKTSTMNSWRAQLSFDMSAAAMSRKGDKFSRPN